MRIIQSVLNLLSLSLAISLLGLIGCGDGGGGDEPASRVCSTLKIAGGEECDPGPSSVAVVATRAGYCSGVYITTRHVLTAAHCIPSLLTPITVISEGIRGTSSRSFIHPAYDGSIDSPFDIAVVALAQDAPVRPIPLMLSRMVRVGDRVSVYGFGLDEDGNDIVKRIEKGESPLKATFLTVSSVDPGTIKSLSDGGDTCRGDSGGSLLLEGVNGEPGVVAIVRAGPNICDPDNPFPSDNSNVQSAAIVDFIRQVAPGTRLN